MKTSRLLAAACAATFAGAASADIMFADPGTLAGGQSVVYTVNVTTGGTGVLSFDFTNGNPAGDSSWASDVQIDVSGQSAGGFTNVGSATEGAWSFDGSASTNDGTYTDGNDATGTPVGPPALNIFNSVGTYTLTFTNDWSTDPDPNTYTNLVIAGIDGTATVVPEPGSLALLGLGGLAMLRRRR
jgi:hypothetical protein